ncbi:hypothetical protein Tco_0516091 [Tanacetum coccineum]
METSIESYIVVDEELVPSIVLVTLCLSTLTVLASNLLSFRGCLTNLPLLLKNFLKSFTAMAYSSSSLPEVKHSSSLDSFLAFKARDFLSTFALTIGIFLDDHLMDFEVSNELIKR